MKVNEIFKSIQGESTWQGLHCVFIRLSGCNLRCSWCDTKYVYENGNEMSVDEIIHNVGADPCVCPEIMNKGEHIGSPLLVEITGGEPLLQEEVYELSNKLLAKGYKVLIETNGSISADRLSNDVIRIIDIKCPRSGMSDKVYWDNLNKLRPMDEIKFVLSDEIDYEWAKEVIEKYRLSEKAKVLFSPVLDNQTIRQSDNTYLLKLISEWILRDNLPVRLQLQLHKYIGVR
ncbi:MAG: radical SAM protein [Candidatus Stahlbacteria bacterium]|nr:radical SAM protein [Candidatus Stahlbacteria bacterium]